jgi:poly-D-alanine transfer protein DltD
MSIGEIVGLFDALMQSTLKGKQVIFTVSPIRHLKDGFEENSLSKATLRLAIGELCEKHGAHYFPAYEILMDDLRDYRFYASDLAHPSADAVEYIWEKFSAAAFTPETREVMSQIEEITRAARHRPFNPDTDEHRNFRRTMLSRTRRLAATHPEIDLSAEIAFFA